MSVVCQSQPQVEGVGLSRRALHVGSIKFILVELYLGYSYFIHSMWTLHLQRTNVEDTTALSKY